MSDQVALETEARISPLINEKKRLFNDLLTAKGIIYLYTLFNSELTLSQMYNTGTSTYSLLKGYFYPGLLVLI